MWWTAVSLANCQTSYAEKKTTGKWLSWQVHPQVSVLDKMLREVINSHSPVQLIQINCPSSTSVVYMPTRLLTSTSIIPSTLPLPQQHQVPVLGQFSPCTRESEGPLKVTMKMIRLRFKVSSWKIPFERTCIQYCRKDVACFTSRLKIQNCEIQVHVIPTNQIC